MKELLRKYAEIILNVCLKVENKQPLFIRYNKENKDFIDIIIDVAKEKDIEDIYLNEEDPYENHRLLLEKDVEELKILPNWNTEKWNEYANKNAAFIMLTSPLPGLMSDVDQVKLTEMRNFSNEMRNIFNDKRDKSELAWNISAVPSKMWADLLYPNNTNSIELLWNKIFDICLIKEDNPQELWKEKNKLQQKRANLLTKYQFKKLLYKNNSGTNLQIELPDNHIWATAIERINKEKDVIVNFPSEEVFTSPKYDGVNGIVYSAKPLVYQDVVIEDFYLEFSKGKVVNFDAKKGKETLKMMINICENSNYLGEVALVPYDSPISNQKMCFYETLYDENASCHLALGDSFPECIENGINISKEKLFEINKINKCISHVDFMVGTSDLSIIGITNDDEEIEIFKNGNYSEIFS